MHKYQVGCLVVAEGEGTVEGIVSEQDIFRQLAALEGDVSQTLVRDVMTTNVLVCGPADHIDTARSIMKTHRIHQVPVVDDEGTLLGIVSIDDVNAHLITEHAVEINYLHDYIEGRVR
jgi:CBS domain-containing protein